MTLDSIRPSPLTPQASIEADAATAILRMLTSDLVDPSLRCRADGDEVSSSH